MKNSGHSLREREETAPGRQSKDGEKGWGRGRERAFWGNETGCSYYSSRWVLMTPSGDLRLLIWKMETEGIGGGLFPTQFPGSALSA